MQTSANRPTHQQKDHSYLNVILILSWAIFFLPYYVLLGLQLVMPAGTVSQWWEPLLVPIFLWILFVSWLVFSKIIAYVLISLIAITSGLTGFMWGHKGKWARLSSLLGALSVIALPWLLPYQPSLQPAAGYTMQVLTPPSNPIEGFVKFAYVLSDEVPCEYDILGWNAVGQLYYQSQCGSEEEIWAVNPNQPDEPQRLEDLPSEFHKEKIAKSDVLEMVRAGANSEGMDMRGIYLREGSLLSLDGEWIAIVSQHIYGPQDVLLLREAKSSASKINGGNYGTSQTN